MQTPAEKYLIKKVAQILMQSNNLENARILNVGAGESIVLESSILSIVGNKFICDRMDVTDCRVKHPNTGECFIASVESMPEIKSNQYELAFANYVLEHVADLGKAAAEIHRVLKPSGYFITSLPNISAPEFILSKYTPTKFHQFIKGEGEGRHAYETQYAFKNIKGFIKVFEKYFSVVEIRYWSNTLGYLYRFPVISIISKVYDKIINYLNIKMLMGNVCIVFKKNV
ncbi:MAG: class I SAM-dependent methyltransferase [Candidatus Buchananbacteria bacterium]|nr:class I SAM-dependent methyltransferase [Candidatus Buchananbacteria bacterium]